MKSNLARFCKQHGVTRLEIFGSLARGEAHPSRDIDLLVTFPPGVHLGWDLYGLEDELEDILGCDVDLLTRWSAERDENPIGRQAILESPVTSIPPFGA